MIWVWSRDISPVTTAGYISLQVVTTLMMSDTASITISQRNNSLYRSGNWPLSFVSVCYHREAIHEPSVVYFVISISLDALFQCIRIVVVFGDFVTIYYALYVRHNKLVIPVVHCTYICTNVLSCKTVIKPCVKIHTFILWHDMPHWGTFTVSLKAMHVHYVIFIA